MDVKNFFLMALKGSGKIAAGALILTAFPQLLKDTLIVKCSEKVFKLPIQPSRII
jgi:hypothetical protein